MSRLIGIIADHTTPKISEGEVTYTLESRDYKGVMVIVMKDDASKRELQEDVWTLDEKMGQTYVHKECANTLAQRDYKQPQAVIYELPTEDGSIDGE